MNYHLVCPVIYGLIMLNKHEGINQTPALKRIHRAWDIYCRPDDTDASKEKKVMERFLIDTFFGKNANLANPQKELKQKIQELNPGPLKSIDHITKAKSTHLYSTPHRRKEFFHQINQDIIRLNGLIDNYNQETDLTNKKNLLDQLAKEVFVVSNTYPASSLAYLSDITLNLQVELFENIKKQKESIDTLSRITNSATATPRDCSLPKIIERMSPYKVAELMEILHSGKNLNQSDFNSLYTTADPTDEYKDFKTFLKTHEPIIHLGGGNSQNFLIQPRNGQKPLTLKLENRLDQPANAEIYLRENSLKDVLSTQYISRNGTFMYTDSTHQQSFTVNRNLVVTEYYPDGNLLNHAATLNDNKRLESSLNIYKQMAHVLCNMTNEGCAFPDMKNTNWLIDGAGKIKVADSKAFIFTDANGDVNLYSPKNEWNDIVSTEYVSPPEMYQSAPFSADKMHAYILGKNLYEYLTITGESTLFDLINDGNQLSFENPIFKSDEGIRLKSLICSLIQPSPQNRITVQEALDVLTDIPLNKLKHSLDVHLTFITQNPTLVALHTSLISSNDALDITEKRAALEAAIVSGLQTECYLFQNHIDKITGQRTSINSLVQFGDLDKLAELRSHLNESLCIQLKEDCAKILNSIQKKGFGPHDNEMKKFLNEQKALVQIDDDATKLIKIHSHLTSVLHVQESQHIQKLKQLMVSSTSSLSLILDTSQNNQKLQVQNTMSSIPVEQRTPDNPQIQQLFEKKDNNNKLTTPLISPNHDNLSSFKKMKAKFQEETKEETLSPPITRGIK